MLLERFEVPGLAHYSYLLGSEGQAVVIDPSRDADTYTKYASEKGLAITHILETHIHADYASGATALARATDAELWLSGHDEREEYQYQFPHHRFRDGEELTMGDLRIVALHTPGHTPEHLSFLVFEQSRCGQPMALFSGDFLFVGSLGRPDLLGEDAKRSLARSLFRSVHGKITGLPDGAEIYPAHGAGSLCGSGISQRPHSTLGYERFCNVLLSGYSEEQFVDSILSSVPEFPAYYRRMKRINAQGPPLLDAAPGDLPLSLVQFREMREQPDTVVIDLRRPEAFGGAHIPLSFNIGAGQNLSLWAAWVVPYDCPILLVGDEHTDFEQARRSLFRIGFDYVQGFLTGGIEAWIEAGHEQAHTPQVSVRELDHKLRSSTPYVLDVRSPKEWQAGHIAGAIHVPGGDLQKRLDEIPKNAEIYVICGSGYRSSVATSILERAGYTRAINVVGGMGAWMGQQLPTV
jgi:hydroxyacylglutathione hydrolase